jgi:DNA-binding NarL/FixJ family response regulator
MSAALLLIDDDPVFRSLVRELLFELGIEPIEQAESAAEAIAKAHTTRPRAALVDVGLPDLDGIQLAHELATLPWRPTVVLVSVDRDVAARIGLSNAKTAIPFIPKDELPDAPLRSLLRLD